ncbi:D-alanyl-D-alanine carboxypeptidase family protein [uncultured Clostridium sp.]|jgi:D-alanyl-D-alanine carboxypeptidase|uniref:D-alanyl-D-alanine carboxypeptidase family protein n=1 Tax=uncultured Clostridium sp. TaxID=59620 RepID=UPI00261CE0C1|nr:D-alanyl-D-alanine carboxypeptidase family protein [uncultured Clostridium sp.]
MKKNKGILLGIMTSLLVGLFTTFPTTQVLAQTNNEKPSIVGKSAITMDLATGEIIYAKDIDTKRYPASITKLMTALVFAENADKDSIIPFTKSASVQPAYSLAANYAPIAIGDSLSGSDTMDALLLFSANDSAYMIGDYVAGSNEEFIKLMNTRAKELGLKNTNFTNPNGLHNPEHYTTAYDLSLLAKVMLQNPWIKETMATKDAQIEFNDSGKRIDIENRNKLLGKDGNIGGKTGFTDPAGRCLLAFYQRGGRSLVGIVLNSEYGATDTQVFDDMDTIMDYSFAAKKSPYRKVGDIVTEIEAKYKTFGFFGKEKTIKIPVSINKEIQKYDNLLDEKNINLSVNTTDMDAWNIAGNTELTTIFSEKGSKIELTASAQISNFTIIKENLVYYITRIGGVLGIIILLVLAFFSLMKRKSRRNSFYTRRRKNIFK